MSPDLSTAVAVRQASSASADAGARPHRARRPQYLLVAGPVVTLALLVTVPHDARVVGEVR